MRYIYRGVVVALILFNTSCMDVATTGAQAVYNRHSIQKNFQDQYITLQANKILKVNSEELAHSNIAVATYHREILLVGQVDSQDKRSLALDLVKTVPEVKAIYNEVTVGQPLSTLTHLGDSFLTAKVKAKLIASNDVDAAQVKVVTENGVVYLMGILPKPEAQAAASLAAETQGVRRVVTIFSYINISKG